MTPRWAVRLGKWLVGPLLVAALGALVGQKLADSQRGRFFDATRQLTASELQAVELGTYAALANAAWAFGDATAVKTTLHAELDRLPESSTKERARALLRLGLIDPNPEGQASIFAQCCMLDPSLCDHVADVASREVALRYVPPGNQLPVSLLEGHPPLGGR
jgi:hypothetical protein